jgi:protein-S-isoprenylcysteine O-methyltransferase Ste14
MSDQTPPSTIKPFWRRGVAGILDFLTVFFVGGYVIGKFTGETTSDGFSLTGAPALVLFVAIAAYFYLGWKKLGGTIWQRILKAR